MSDLQSKSNPNEDLPFQHYTRTHRVVAWVSSNVFDRTTYTVRRGLLKGMRRKGGLAWIPALSAEAMNAEDQFWSALDLSDLTVYDIGAFQGLLTLFFASRCKTVVSFEPNSRNNKRLLENLALNEVRNVQVRKIGIGARSEIRPMVASALMPGGASLDAKVIEGLVNAGMDTATEEIPINALDDEIVGANLPKPDLIKIDTEGWEIEALRGACQTLSSYSPALFLEMHGETIREKKRKVAEIVAFLWELNYRNIRHVETNTVITPYNTAVAMEGHLYCKTGEDRLKAA
jgi:FkbM family methyltransferase